MTNQTDDRQGELEQLFTKSPIEKNVPDDVWGTIHPTWTGLWTDAYGEWDELQPSDIYPLTELLSEDAESRLKAAIQHLIDQARLDGRRIQAEATADKWRTLHDEGDFNTFVHGQVEAWRYEQLQAQKHKVGEDNG